MSEVRRFIDFAQRLFGRHVTDRPHDDAGGGAGREDGETGRCGDECVGFVCDRLFSVLPGSPSPRLLFPVTPSFY